VSFQIQIYQDSSPGARNHRKWNKIYNGKAKKHQSKTQQTTGQYNTIVHNRNTMRANVRRGRRSAMLISSIQWSYHNRTKKLEC